MPPSPAPDPPLPLDTLRRVFDGVADGVVVADAAGRVVYLNPAAERLHGTAVVDVPLAEWSARYRLFTLDGAPYPPAELPLARAALAGETVASACWRVRPRDAGDAGDAGGSDGAALERDVILEGTASPLVDAQGGRTGALLVLRDVTEREALRARLSASEAQFRQLSDTAPVGIFRADLDGRVTWVNARVGEIWGRPDTALLGHGWLAGVHPDDAPALLAGWQAANATGAEFDHVYRVVRGTDGGVRHVHGRSAVLRDASGVPVGTVGTVEDTTGQHAAERSAEGALREQRRIADILERVTDGVLLLDDAWRVTYVNTAGARVLGRPPEALLGRTVAELWPGAVGDEAQARYGRALATGHPVHFVQAWDAPSVPDAPNAPDAPDAPAPTERWLEVDAYPGADAGRDGVAVFFRDVTARVRGERAVAESEARLRASLAAERRARRRTELLQELTAAFSAMRTADEVARVVLERGVDAFGTRSGLVARLDRERGVLVPLGMRGYTPEVEARFRVVPLGAPLAITAVVRDAAPVWLDDPAEAVRRFPALAEVYAMGGFVATAALPLLGGDGRPIGALAFNYDTPQAFAPEERALLEAVARQCAQALERARLFEAEREARQAAEEANAAKSRFLATTSHELRTPINAVLGYAELLEMGLVGPLNPEQRGYLERVRVAGRNLLALVNQVLDLSKIEADRIELQVGVGRAADVAARALAQVEPQAGAKGVALTNACAAGDRTAPAASDPAPDAACAPATFVGDAQRVEQLLVNLLANAVKFTPAGGRVTLSAARADTPAPDALLDRDLAPHGWMYFRVEDTGIGIPPHRLSAIWEPFEQADASHTRVYGGTGLGLTISRRLARLMGGDITVRSEEGAGSTFLVWLPAAATPTVARQVAERRGGARLARGLVPAADAALAEIEGVLRRYVTRLRHDPATPGAHALSEGELENHVASLLADMSSSLALIEEARGRSSESLRDGTRIQRVIAERHGAQRARSGWREPEVRREFAILREELEAAVRRRTAGEPDVAVDEALALFARFIARAEQASLRPFADG